MEIAFNLIDSNEKRWYGKVIRKIETAVNEKIRGICGEEKIYLGAYFNHQSLASVSIIEETVKGEDFTVITFATKSWETLTACLEDAQAQLESALLRIFQEKSARDYSTLSDCLKNLSPLSIEKQRKRMMV